MEHRRIGQPNEKVGEVIKESKVDIIYLEGSKLTSPSINVLSKLGRRFMFIVKDSKGASGGIIIALDPSVFDLIDHKEGRYSLSVIVERRADGWMQMVMAVYGPHHSE